MENEILNLNLSAEQALEGTISSLNLNNYGLFYVVLKEHANFHFFRHLVQNPERSYYTPEQHSLRYDLIETRELQTDVPGILCYEFYLRVKINGKINEYNERGITFREQPFQLECIACAKHFTSSYGVIREGLKLYDETQYRFLIDEREIQLIKKREGWLGLNAIRFNGLDYTTFFTTIWNKPLADPNDKPRKDEIAEHTSLNFLWELEGSYSTLLFAVAKALQLKNYVGSFKDNYFLHGGRKRYYIENNAFLNRHLEYLSMSFSAAYAFWERLTFLVGLHLLPGKLRSLSYFKLFDQQLQQVQTRFPSIASSTELVWLTDRAKTRHQDLNKFRHPLIHYQYQEKELRGNMNSDLFRLMLEHIDDEQELQTLFANLDDAMIFVQDEIKECVLGFEHTISLLKNVQEPF